MRRMVGWLVLVLVGAAAPAAAQKARKPQPKPRPFEARIKFNALFFDNFFQAAEGSPEEGVQAGGVEAHLARKLKPNRPLEVFGHADYVAYRGFGPSAGVTAGLRSEGKPQGFELSAQYLKGRPSREVGDVLDRADALVLGGGYSYRITDDVQLTGLADYRKEHYDLSPLREYDAYNLGGAVRYRGFGSGFSPEIGLRWGKRDVLDDNEDLSQRELFVRLRWTPTRDAYLTLRYRRRSRDYSPADVQASNFGREDTRTQWTLGADLRRGERLTWSLYYAREDSDSTRPSGVFQTQLVVLGLTLRL